MQCFNQESQSYQDMKEKESIIEEFLDVIDEIKDDLKELSEKENVNLKNEINILIFTYKWKMRECYVKAVKYVREQIFEKKYEAEFLESKLCKEIWNDLFNSSYHILKLAWKGLLPYMKIAVKYECKWKKVEELLHWIIGYSKIQQHTFF